MTKVTFYQNQDRKFSGFDVCEHAGAAPSGSDVVCAAISALVFNTVNSIEALTDDTYTCDVDEKGAAIRFRIDAPDEKSELLMKSLSLGLQQIEDDETSSEFIDIIFEEV